MSQTSLAAKSGGSLGSLKRFEQSGQIAFASLLKLAYVLNPLSDFESILKQEEDLAQIDQLFSEKMRANG